MSVRITFDKAKAAARIHAASEKATYVITNEFIKDANYFCKEDTGELERSAIRASRPEEGLAIWDTPYAKNQLYTGKPSTDRNPNASTMWGHKAKRKNKDKYNRMTQKIIDQEV
jgi:hypothetical protein